MVLLRVSPIRMPAINSSLANLLLALCMALLSCPGSTLASPESGIQPGVWKSYPTEQLQFPA